MSYFVYLESQLFARCCLKTVLVCSLSVVRINFLSSLSPCPVDLVLLACNWSTMGDSFFVCHHLAALYAYGYVLVSLTLQLPECVNFVDTSCVVMFLSLQSLQTRGVLPYFANFRLISELSTPFVNQR